jgi:hypothetical protein
MNYNDLLTFWKDELIVLNLFIRRWEIAQCAEIFDRVTRQLFRAERQRANVFRTIRRILQCWLSDDCYDVEIFEILLKKNFENQQRMFDSLQLNSEAKIAVTITTISDVFSFVFSNYNEIDIRHSDNDKFAFWTRKFSYDVCRLWTFSIHRYRERVLHMKSVSECHLWLRLN